MKATQTTLLILSLFLSTFSVAQAHEITKDKDISLSLNVLKQYNQTETLDRLNKNKVTIEFYNLFDIDFKYYNYYAMYCTDEQGNNYILINKKLNKSPHIALASLIAHESMHALPVTEKKAVAEEIRTWKLLRKDLTDADKKDVLVIRLEKLLTNEQ